MTQKVKPGEQIRASQLNNVIDSVSIRQVNAEQPFRATTAGTMTNGGHTSYVTKAPSRYDALFNVTYGAGRLDTDSLGFNREYFNGMWVQMSDWRQGRLNLYHSQFFERDHDLVLLIDPTDTEPNLIPISTIAVYEYDKTGRWPICEAKKEAGLAVFQIFMEPSAGQLFPYQGACVTIIGDFTKFGAESGTRPDFGTIDNYRQYIQEFFPTITIQSVALRHTVPLYTRRPFGDIDEPDPMYVRPIAWTVGQQHIESMPDADQSGFSVGKDVYLSSLVFTTAKQFGSRLNIPTFSFSLYNFEHFPSDYYDLSSILSAEDLSGGDGDGSGLSAFDILVRHKAHHPDGGSGVLSAQSTARLEYVALSALVSNPDSNLSSAETSSVQWRETDDGNVLQLFQFHDMENSWHTLSAAMEYQQHIVLRNADMSCVDYIDLSCLSGGGGGPGKADADLPAAGLSSVQTRNVGGEDVLQLYNFNNPSVTTIELSDQNRYDFVMRDNQSGQVQYAHLSGVGGQVTLSGTDNSTWMDNKFKFRSMSDSNVIVHIDNGILSVGVYYL